MPSYTLQPSTLSGPLLNDCMFSNFSTSAKLICISQAKQGGWLSTPSTPCISPCREACPSNYNWDEINYSCHALPYIVNYHLNYALECQAARKHFKAERHCDKAVLTTVCTVGDLSVSRVSKGMTELFSSAESKQRNFNRSITSSQAQLSYKWLACLSTSTVWVACYSGYPVEVIIKYRDREEVVIEVVITMQLVMTEVEVCSQYTTIQNV